MRGFNFYLGASASAWLLTIMVILSELFEPFKESLKETFSHHWIGKLVIITIAFFALGFLVKEDSIKKISNDKFAWRSIIGSLIIIILFFIFEYFK